MTDTVVRDEIAAFDLDGTLADCDGELKSRMAHLASPGEPPYVDRYGQAENGVFDGEDVEPPHIKARRKLIQGTPGFWRGLPRIARGFEVLEEARNIGFIIDVLTKGPKKQSIAWSEKNDWCLDNLPEPYNMNIGTEKSRFYGKVLVDDFPPYFLKWLAVRKRGLVVCVAQPWNEKFRNPTPNERGREGVQGDPHSQVFRYDGTNREELRKRLQHAYDRKPGEY